jgi:hypothetical protein
MTNNETCRHVLSMTSEKSVEQTSIANMSKTRTLETMMNNCFGLTIVRHASIAVERIDNEFEQVRSFHLNLAVRTNLPLNTMSSIDMSVEPM